ncbi:hypothetical protein K4F52_003048 [Lecanicillium sp. MT-2017a]|nr:hypothetical protein K4F52_003048 [Lecanicillium sp. MT-2017a]
MAPHVLTPLFAAPPRPFHRRKSLGELVQGLKAKYSRERITQDSNLARNASDGSLPNSSGDRSAAPYGMSHKSAVPSDTLPKTRPHSDSQTTGRYAPLSLSISDAPRLELLPDITADNLQRSSTFRTGLEKAVDDINTKYGDNSKPYVASTSPTSSVAIRSRNGFRPRYQLPTFVQAHASRVQPKPGVTATLETVPLTSGKADEAKDAKDAKAGVPESAADSTSPFDDANNTNSYDNSTAGAVLENTGPNSQPAMANRDASDSSSLPDSTQGSSYDETGPGDTGAVEKFSASTDADSGVDQHGGAPLSEEEDSETNSDDSDSSEGDGVDESSATVTAKYDRQLQERDDSKPPERSIRQPLQRAESGRAVPTSRKQRNPSDEEVKQHGTSCRTPSGVSVAQLVNRFRSMEGRSQQTASDEQEESSAESTTKLIQSYRRSSSEESNDGSGYTTPTDHEKEPILKGNGAVSAKAQKMNWHSET